MAFVQYTRPIDRVISLSDQENKELEHLHKDALVLALEIKSFLVRCVLINNKSVVNIMHQSMLVQMGYQVLALRSLGGILTGFNGS